MATVDAVNANQSSEWHPQVEDLARVKALGHLVVSPVTTTAWAVFSIGAHILNIISFDNVFELRKDLCSTHRYTGMLLSILPMILAPPVKIICTLVERWFHFVGNPQENLFSDRTLVYPTGLPFYTYSIKEMNLKDICMG